MKRIFPAILFFVMLLAASGCLIGFESEGRGGRGGGHDRGGHDRGGEHEREQRQERR